MIVYEDAIDACMALIDVPPDSDEIDDYPKLVSKNGELEMDSLQIETPSKLYPAERAIINKVYKKTVNVDNIRVDWSGGNTRHQLAGRHQIRMRKSDFCWYKIAKLIEADMCPGYNIEEEWIPGELITGHHEIAAGLVHEAFHIHQRGRGINVTWEWIKSLPDRAGDESNEKLYGFDKSIKDAKAFWEHFQSLTFEGQSEVYEDFYMKLAGNKSGADLNKFEFVVRFVVDDYNSSWKDILGSMR